MDLDAFESSLCNLDSCTDLCHFGASFSAIMLLIRHQACKKPVAAMVDRTVCLFRHIAELSTYIYRLLSRIAVVSMAIPDVSILVVASLRG